MKFKHLFALYFLSLILSSFGALAKLEHWSMAWIFLFGAMLLQIFVYIVAGIKLLRTKKFQEFLNS